MDDQVIDQKLQEALKLHDEGKSYSEIRMTFQDELSDETISYIIRLVDEFVMEENRISEEIKKAKFKMHVALAAFALSCFVLYLLHSNNALSGIKNQTVYTAILFIQYFPVIGTLYLLWRGYKEEQVLKKTQPEIDDTKFRLKRRKKK